MAADDATVGTTAWLDSAIGSLFKSDSSGSAPPSGTLVPPTTTESIADDSSLSSVFGAWAVTTENPAPISGSGNIEEGCGGSDFWQWASSAADGLSLEALRPSIGLGIDSFGNSGASAPALRSDTSRGDSAALNLSDEVATLSVKDLKSLIKRAGLSDQSCVERNDLEALAVVAQKRLLEAEALKQSTAASSAAAARRGTGASALAHDIADKHGKHPVRVFAGLNCTIVGEKTSRPGQQEARGGHQIQPADFLVFFFHGYQATGESLAPLADLLRASVAHGRSDDANRIIFVLPQSQGAGWWDIDFASYALAMAMGEESKARTLRAVPSGVLPCRALIKQLVAECREFYGNPANIATSTSKSGSPSSGAGGSNSTGSNGAGSSDVSSGAVPAQRTFFMGFSQGAMLALDAALHVNEGPLGGVVLVSGFLMDVDTWADKLAKKHKNLKVLQIHGLNDPLIPFGTAKWLQALLAHYSNKAVFVPHSGGHDVPQHAISTIAGFLNNAML